MDRKKYRFLKIANGVTVPVPKELNQEEVAAILAQAKAEFDPLASEVECTELLKLREKGLLVSGDELQKKLEAMEIVVHERSGEME